MLAMRLILFLCRPLFWALELVHDDPPNDSGEWEHAGVDETDKPYRIAFEDDYVEFESLDDALRYVEGYGRRRYSRRGGR